jgi:Uncharacterised ACR, YagE family COG1723
MWIRPVILVRLQGLPMETYLTAFSYGSVVIFNAQSDLLTQALLNMCREFTKSRVDDQYAEELMVRIRPDLAVRGCSLIIPAACDRAQVSASCALVLLLTSSVATVCTRVQAPSWHSPEHIKLKQLDWNNIRVISAVLGQSVALDFYARQLTQHAGTYHMLDPHPVLCSQYMASQCSAVQMSCWASSAGMWRGCWTSS